MIGSVLEQEDLMRLTGLRQKAALRRHLRKAGIRFTELGGRISTTEQAFNDALAGRGQKNKINEPIWGDLRE